MLITNIDITDLLISGQVGVVKYFKFLLGKVDIICKSFDDINADKRLRETDSLSRHNSWVPIKRTDTHINIGNSYISASIQRTQFPLTLAWECTTPMDLRVNLTKIGH